MALYDPLNETRNAPRFACNLPASVRDRGRPRSPARVIDISTDGCRLEAISGLTAGSWVWLNLPGLETQYMRVAWSCDAFAGLEFAVALSPAVLRTLVAIEQAPSERHHAQLQELSHRCELLAERAPDDQVDRLLALAHDCAARAVVEDLRTRFG